LDAGGDVVQKLVLANGSWKDRRWNERWLEANIDTGPNVVPTEVKYFTKQHGFLINVISAEDIHDVIAIIDELNQKASENDFPKSSPLLSLVMDKLPDDDRDELQFAFLIQCKPEGSAVGKEFLFKVNSEQELRSWVSLFLAMKSSVKPMEPSRLKPVLNALRTVHRSYYYQAAMALVIYLNFIVCVVGAQLNPIPGSSDDQMLERFDIALTWVFTADLLLNLATSSFFSEFCKSSWNWCPPRHRPAAPRCLI
jgi:hypothetical protein